jgi:excisionase family DNA binding protein
VETDRNGHRGTGGAERGGGAPSSGTAGQSNSQQGLINTQVELSTKKPGPARVSLIPGERESVHRAPARDRAVWRSLGARVSASGGRPALLTADELAELLRTTRGAVYSAVERAQIPGVVRLGRRLLFRERDVLDWLGLDPPIGPGMGLQAPHRSSQSTGCTSPQERACPRTPKQRRQGP